MHFSEFHYNSRFFFLILLFSLMGQHFFGCSHFSSTKKNLNINDQKVKFDYTDASGSYHLYRETGVLKKKRELFTKIKLVEDSGDINSPVEKLINISTIEKFDKQVNILRPKVSQFSVWLNGKKYFSQMKFDYHKNSFNLFTIDPDSPRPQKKTFPLPSGTNGVYCFFSQISECVQTSDFIKKAIEMNFGKMNFQLVWDNYPYTMDQYKYLPDKAIAKAIFEYDGKNTEGIHRFFLKVDGQTIFYHFDDNFNFIKKFWVSQGITQVKSVAQ